MKESKEQSLEQRDGNHHRVMWTQCFDIVNCGSSGLGLPSHRLYLIGSRVCVFVRMKLSEQVKMVWLDWTWTFCIELVKLDRYVNVFPCIHLFLWRVSAAP